MNKTLSFAVLGAASLLLAACGSSDSATEQATPDNVEMPAEETLSTVAAMPVPDSGTEAADPNAGAKANDAAAAAAAAAADFNAAGDGEENAGAEQAIDQAEKKM